MKRFFTICCGLALAAASGTALCAPPATNSNQAMLARRGLSDFDLDGNGKLDESERAAALAARTSARHQTAFAATATLGNQNSLTVSPSTTGNSKGQGGNNRNAKNSPYTNTAASPGGSILVVNDPYTQCPIENAMRQCFSTPHPISGGSVVSPVNIYDPGNSSATITNGSIGNTGGNGRRIIVPSNLPHPAVYNNGPQLPNSSSFATTYWVPPGGSFAQAQPFNPFAQSQGFNPAMAHTGHRGR